MFTNMVHTYFIQTINIFGITLINSQNSNNIHTMSSQITKGKCIHSHSTCGHSTNYGVLKLKKRQKKSSKNKGIKVKFKTLKTKHGQWLVKMYTKNSSTDIQSNSGISRVINCQHQSSKDSQ